MQGPAEPTEDDLRAKAHTFRNRIAENNSKINKFETNDKNNEEWVEWHEQQLREALQHRDEHREQYAKLRQSQAQDEHDLRETEDAISKKTNVRCLYNNLHIPCSPADVTTAQALYISALLEQYKILQAQPAEAVCRDEIAETLRAAAAITGQPLHTGVPGEFPIDLRYDYEPLDDSYDPTTK